MVSKKVSVISFTLALGLSFAGAFWSVLLPGARNQEAEARHHHAHVASHHSGAQSSSHHGAGHSSRRHHGHSGHGKHAKHVAAADKHAYALDFFMMKAPDFDRSQLDDDLSNKIKDAFARGIADDLSAEKLVRA